MEKITIQQFVSLQGVDDKTARALTLLHGRNNDQRTYEQWYNVTKLFFKVGALKPELVKKVEDTKTVVEDTKQDSKKTK